MRVEKLSFYPGGAGQGVGSAIERVAGHRAACGGGVDPDLVGAPGEKFQFQQGGAGPGAEDFPVSAGGAASGAHGHFLAVNGVAADRAFPGADLALGASQHKGEVGFPGFAILELAAEFAVGVVRFGGDQNAGGLQIETVDDAGALGAAAGGELPGAMVEQGGGEGAGGPTRTGVDGQAGWFVEDDDIGVLIQDIQGDGFRFHVSWGGGGDPDGDGGAGGKKVAGLRGLAGNFHEAGLHPLLNFAAGFPAESRQHEVSPFVGIRGARDPAPDPFLGRGGFSARLLGMTGHVFLILPFFCSLVYAIGALLLKRSMETGHPPRHAMVACNLAIALFSLPLLFLAKSPPAGLSLWVWLTAPACSGLFFFGQIATFRALARGDVSVATPVLGTKVLMTALIGAVFLPGGVDLRLWLGALLGTGGVALVGWHPGARPEKMGPAVGWSLLAAASFSLTDVLVAKVANQVGFCLFGPWMMAGMAAISLIRVPSREWRGIGVAGRGWIWAWAGALLIGLQGSFLYAAIGLSGDPVGVNVVYAVRGLWSVLLVALVGKRLGDRGEEGSRRVLFWRGLGASLLLGAVWVVLG